MKILIMGLPGSGKTTLAKSLLTKIKGSVHYNADQVRTQANDWDFSHQGRLRQAHRMRALASQHPGQTVLLDFVCPLEESRYIVEPDVTIWMDTVPASRFADTDAIFEPPTTYTTRITRFWDDKAPTVQLLGRYQPWHQGHQALFDRAVAKTGQVAIMVRNAPGENNPYTFEHVQEMIDANLAVSHPYQYKVIQVPNIVNITYGRDVGYTIEKECLGADIESISATKIRSEMNKGL
jgi:Adenylylsulphate kinase